MIFSQGYPVPIATRYVGRGPVDLAANLTENEDRSRTFVISSECDF